MIPGQYKGKVRKREKASKVRSIDLNDVRIFLFQVLRGLAYCHDRRILHRDLKDSFNLTSTKREPTAGLQPTLTYQNGPCFVNFDPETPCRSYLVYFNPRSPIESCFR